MMLDEAFRRARFGMLTERFGVDWMPNCELAKSAPARRSQASGS